jgi:hypothetical protein
MAAITAKEEQAKKARVSKGVDAMKKPEKQAGTLRNISVRPADNGYTVGVEREPDADDKKDKAKGDMPISSYTPPKESVFGGKTAKQDVLDHIAKHLD